MTRIVTTTYRYKRPPRKPKAVPLAGPAVVTPKRKPTVAKKLEPDAAIVRKAKPCNDNRPDVVTAGGHCADGEVVSCNAQDAGRQPKAGDRHYSRPEATHQ